MIRRGNPAHSLASMTREEAQLMPRYALRVRPDPALDAGRHRDERDIAMLQGQLRALDSDIRRARAVVAARRGSNPAGHPGARPDSTSRGELLRLECGAEIRIRPIEPQDAPHLKEGVERLSSLTRYKRFLGGLDRLSARQLEYLTVVDHVDHEALVAVDAGSGGGVGVARYVRDAHDPRLAEVAVVVTDAWQGRGVGSALFARLAERARAAGIERLVGRSIVGDRAARALAAHAGAGTVTRHLHGTTEHTVRLAGAPAVAPTTDFDTHRRRARRRQMHPATSARRLPAGGDPPVPLPVPPLRVSRSRDRSDSGWRREWADVPSAPCRTDLSESSSRVAGSPPPS